MDEEGNPLAIQCGFCLRKNFAIQEPKQLPCSHVHCQTCLDSFFGANHKVFCPLENCRKICGVPIAELPVYEIAEDTSRSCDVCLKKEKKIVDALVYCMDCSKKFCSSHLEKHDEILSEHSNITVRDYLEQAIKLETRTCQRHEGCPYTLGCEKCFTVVCVQCTADPSPCRKNNEDSHHNLIELNKLVKSLMEKDIQAKIMAKEDELQSIFKEASKAQAFFDQKTTELVKLLHERRDEQVKAITEEYDLLEKELLKKRQDEKVQLADFMYENVLTKWTELRNYRLRIETQAAHMHQADIIQGYQKIFEETQKLLEEGLPAIELPQNVELSILNEKRETEFTLKSSGKLRVNSYEGASFEPAATAPISVSETQPPKAIASLHQLFSLNGSFYSIVYSNGTYKLTSLQSVVGTSGSNVVNHDLGVQAIIDTATHEDKLFLLSKSSVSVYNSQFREVANWKIETGQISHGDVYPKSLAVVSDQVVVSIYADAKMAVYTFSGELVKLVCYSPMACANQIALLNGGNGSVVCWSGSQQASGFITKINLSSGLKEWTSEELPPLEAVVSYNDKYLFLAYKNKLTVLDNQTGKQVRTFTLFNTKIQDSQMPNVPEAATDPPTYLLTYNSRQYSSGYDLYAPKVPTVNIKGLATTEDTLVLLTSISQTPSLRFSVYKMKFEQTKITG